jgi:hypothetical protein
MSARKLMSIVEAAGYAMAAVDEIDSESCEFQPEVAFRNGHQSAARALAKPIGMSPPAAHVESLGLWLRDVVGPWWGGRAPA